MKLLDIMLNRRSERIYNDEKIPKEKIKQIIEAGLLTPSSKGIYPVEMIVVEDKQTIQELSKCKTAGAHMLNQATCAIVVIGDSQKADAWIEDCSLSMIYMQLMATEVGVANCWVHCRNRMSKIDGISSDEFVKGVCHIPEHYSVLAILSLGMSDQKVKPHTLKDINLSKIHYEKY